MWVMFIGLYVLNTIFMLIVAVREARRPALALNYLAVRLVLPVIGSILYLISSRPVHIRSERLTCPNNESDTLPDSFSRSAMVIAHGLRHFTVNGLRTGQVQVLTNGSETYEELTESLKNAQKAIDLEYYIYRNDRIGSRITELLIERAKAGVQIRFIRDGWASRRFPRSQIVRMMNAGIECRIIFPLRFPRFLSTLNYRDHCKIVVIDGREAFTGGINVGDEYLGLDPKIGFWRDTHLRIVGEVEADLQAIFNAHWKIASPERTSTWISKKSEVTENLTSDTRQGSHKIPTLDSPALSVLMAEWGSDLGTMVADNRASRTKMLREAYVQTLEGNPLIPTPVIRQAYFSCITQAAKTIDITTPYFVPDADIIMAIKMAVARGVRVRLLVPHRVIPGVVGPASRTYYGELLEAGVRIYLYDKGMLHAKVMVIDEEVAEVGAANYDMRSFRLDYEVCEFIYSVDVARDLTEQFESDLMDSIPLRIEDFQKRTIPQRILEQGARLLAPLL
ncbi:phospholipase D-like domain-containing protein [Alicyclobacillus fastidiosus]|uniref:Phospholipase D-like domain-containing protein n=1 Tax=Alicyclobacillus fastidiosus TaxID=392011 RepID=A0ABY6ZP94_9BACL|nr:phospholipase D-like domain-containing protein [Alicyclobacillus fastidiosus]WAH44680.1 phospholipase D-like domain-containing protein [Alicyclobacillus fastidiosus]